MALGKIIGILAKLFEKGEYPLPSIDDPMLGRMSWSKDDEAWVGSHAGFQFALSYDRKAAPTPSLLAYAKAVLADSSWLLSTLEAQKKSLKVPPHVEAELAALKFGLISFSMHRDQGYSFAILDGGRDGRCWRIEYHGHECDGLGFDT